MTTTELTTLDTSTTSTNVAPTSQYLTPDEQQRIVDRMGNATTVQTLRTYGAHVRQFADYCAGRGWAWVPGNVFALDATVRNADETLPTPARVEWVLGYLEHLANNGLSLATIDGRIRALNSWHTQYGFTVPNDPALFRPNDPRVNKWFKGYCNDLANANADGQLTTKEAPAMLRDHLRAMVRACDTSTLVGLRDRALLLVGWSGAFRRSELATVVVENIVWDTYGRGAIVQVYNTKTNKRGAIEKQLDAQPNDPELCPVVALRAWLGASGVSSGRVFRRVDKWGRVGTASVSPRYVDMVVRRYDLASAVAAGTTPEDTTPAPVGFSGHSLRAGYATQATLDGVPDAVIRSQGWSDNSTVVFRYQRRAGRFQQPRVKLL